MNEREFYGLWKKEAAGLGPFEMARTAGALAETPGQIFVAGYQAAVRHTFSEVDHSGWCCFAVTEDRGTDSASPGVAITDGKVSGFKTWIAAADCVDVLVLKIGNGADAIYGSVFTEDPGVNIQLRPGRFLADMSQGAAEFKNAQFVEFTEVQNVRMFRQYEPYYIYVAFLGKLAALDPGTSEGGFREERSGGNDLRDIALTALNEQAAQIDLVQIDLRVAQLLDLMAQNGLEFGHEWSTDKRLFTMYSKGIQR